MVSRSPKDPSEVPSLAAELVAVLEIKREKREVAKASRQELAVRLVTLTSEGKCQSEGGRGASKAVGRDRTGV